MLCGPCALVRWRRILNITVARKTRLDDFLANAKAVTAAGHHPCQAPKPLDPRTSAVVLFPPINQWGHFAVQIRPLTPHAISWLARQAETGLAAHKMLRVDELTTVLHDNTTKRLSPGPPSNRQSYPRRHRHRHRDGTGPRPTSGRKSRSARSRRSPTSSTMSTRGSRNC